MQPCELCGNEYDKSFTVVYAGQERVFDSFEYAIHVLALECGHCGCKIVGYGLEEDGGIYCCGHCAPHSGATEVKDRA